MNLRASLLGPLALASTASVLAASGEPAGVGPQGIPGLAAYRIQHLDLPPLQRGEPAVLAVDLEGLPYTFDLQPHSLRSDDFQLIEVGRNGLVHHPAPAVSTYRGAVYGPDGELVAGARVLGSEDEDGWSLAIDLPGRSRMVVQPLSEMDPTAARGRSGLHVVFDANDVVLDGRYTCAADMAEIGFQPRAGGDDDPPIAFAVTGNEIAEVAFDTDFEFFQASGSDVVATMRDIERVMNIVEATYENEVDITYEISSIVVRSGGAGSDPYTSNDSGTLLSQFQNAWNLGAFPSVRRDIVHLMTGRTLNGFVLGVAFLGVVCNSTAGYGLSATTFTTQLNARAGLTAHEIGHNWNAGHCDGNGDCHIMCSGLGGCNGLGNPITFGAPSQNAIRAFRNTRGCIVNEPDYRQVPFFEDWPQDGFIDPDKWVFVDQVNVRDQGSNEPTPGFSAKLNAVGTNEGEQDDLRSHFIVTTGLSDLSVSFFTQHIGVEAGEELVVEFRNQANRIWSELTRVVSDGVDQTEYVFHKFPLQPNMYHDRFRLRFRVTSDETDDNWFVDNVMVHDGPNLAQDPLVRGALFKNDCYGVAPAQSVVYVASLTGGGELGSGVGPSFFGGAVTLDVLAPLYNLGIVQADGNGVAHRLLFMPFSVAPGTQIWTQALQLEPNLADSKTSNVITQIVQ